MPLLTLSIWFAPSIRSKGGTKEQSFKPTYLLLWLSSFSHFINRNVTISLEDWWIIPCNSYKCLPSPGLFPQNHLLWLWCPFTSPSSLILRKSHSKLIAHCCLTLRKKWCQSPPEEIPTFLLSRTAFVSSPLCATAIFPWRVSTTKGWQFCSSEIPEVEYLVCPIPRFETYSFFRLSALKTWFIRPIPFGRKRKKSSVLFCFSGNFLISPCVCFWYSINTSNFKRKANNLKDMGKKEAE